MAFVAKLRNSLFRNMGACLAPVNAYLNIIGLETLGLRMERECSNALELASWIENNYPDIKVNYPGLDYILSDLYEMYNALCSYGFQEPIEVVKTVAELKNQAENK